MAEPGAHPEPRTLRVAVVTLFPELFTEFLCTSIVGRALDEGRLAVHLEALRAHGVGRHASVDDTPYGGGSGMVMRPDCVVSAIEAAERTLGVERAWRVLLTPQGQHFVQGVARRFADRPALLLVCGRYEGFDERVRYFVDEEISIGDVVLAGGEAAALCVLEATARLLPGVLGNEESSLEESFSERCSGLLEYPQYTRPVEFRGHAVPGVLSSGDHGRVAAWRRARALERTRERRPELLDRELAEGTGDAPAPAPVPSRDGGRAGS